jgi:hypothetical protein
MKKTIKILCLIIPICFLANISLGEVLLEEKINVFKQKLAAEEVKLNELESNSRKSRTKDYKLKVQESKQNISNLLAEYIDLEKELVRQEEKEIYELQNITDQNVNQWIQEDKADVYVYTWVKKWKEEEKESSCPSAEECVTPKSDEAYLYKDKDFCTLSSDGLKKLENLKKNIFNKVLAKTQKEIERKLSLLPCTTQQWGLLNVYLKEFLKEQNK